MNEQIRAIVAKLEQELLLNKSESPQKPSKAAMEHLSEQDKEFIEQIDEEYYTRVKSSDDFYRRKRLILMNLDKLQAKVEKQAKNYDDY
jgi:hypothetical protein